jgi:hypothetical protein
MPRKKRPLKNRYIKGARLSESAFLELAKCYLAMTTANECAFTLKNRHGVVISRQSIVRYFLTLGSYLFNEFFILHMGYLNISMNLRRPEILALNGFLEVADSIATIEYMDFNFMKPYRGEIYEMGSIKSIIAHCIAYAMKYQSYLNDEPISDDSSVAEMPDNRFIVSLLRFDKKKSQGMDNDTFPYHFARAYFIDNIIGEYLPDLQSQYSGRDVELTLLPQVQHVLYERLVLILEKRPIKGLLNI